MESPKEKLFAYSKERKLSEQNERDEGAGTSKTDEKETLSERKKPDDAGDRENSSFRRNAQGNAEGRRSLSLSRI